MKKFLIFSVVCAFALTIFACLISFKMVFSDWCDLRTRYNEVQCSHDGVNPFYVWDRTIVSETYKGLWRPDIRDKEDDKRLPVHSYPPWHTTFFWWYGYLPWSVVVTIMLTFTCSVFLLSFALFRKWAPREGERSRQFVYWSVLSILMMNSFRVDFLLANYGGVLLCCSLILFFGRERLNSIALGAAWAVMMIKPQAAMMFFWPLLFARRYIAIAIAIVICLMATLWPAYVYKESPFDLILLIQRAGIPYQEANLGFFSFLSSKAGSIGLSAWSAVCFAACGVWTFLLRKSSSKLMEYLPICVFLPLWTYSSMPDWVVMWPLYVLMAMELSKRFSLIIFLLAISFPVLYYGYHALSFLGWVEMGMYTLPYDYYRIMHMVIAFIFAIQITSQNGGMRWQNLPQKQISLIPTRGD